MSQFKENLVSLPGIDGIERLMLFEEGEVLGVIENKPGKAGSVAVYHFLKVEYGSLTKEAAIAGVEIFAEHVAAARQTPGAHPNIDLLFDVIENNRELTLQVISKS